MPPILTGFPRFAAEPQGVPFAESRATARLVEIVELRLSKVRNNPIGVELTSDPGGFPEVAEIRNPNLTELQLGDIIAKCNGRPAAGAVRAPIHVSRRQHLVWLNATPDILTCTHTGSDLSRADSGSANDTG